MSSTGMSDAVALGWQHYQAGRLAQAEETARSVVAAEPTAARALDLLGTVVLARGRHAEAVALLRQAVQQKPDFADAYDHLGTALAAQGKPAEAIAAFRQAIRIKPDFAAAHYDLGEALRRQGDLAGAVEALTQALRLRPNFAAAHTGLALALTRLGRLTDAAVHFGYAAQLQPGSAAAHHNLGTVLLDLNRPGEAVPHFQKAIAIDPARADSHNNLGTALVGLEKTTEAIASFEQAIRLRPDHAEARNRLGTALASIGKHSDAIAHLREAVRLRPGHLESVANLATALNGNRQYEDAEAIARQALAANPDHAPLHAVLGGALVGLGKLDAALESCQKAHRLMPGDAAIRADLGFVHAERGDYETALAHYDAVLRARPTHHQTRLNRALVHLLHGRFAETWADYESRWHTPALPKRPFPQPLWDGRSFQGRTILVHAEQGLGDTLHFLRYLPQVKARGGTVILVCQKPLRQLLSNLPSVDRLVVQGEPLPPFDTHIPLMSLPRVFGTTLANIPAEVPYLHADPKLVAKWREPLTALPGFKIGIAWQGAPTQRRDRLRSVPLVNFEPLARIPGVQLISLQKGLGTEQIRALGGRFPVRELGDQVDTTAGPFMDTAAIMKNLDLVISSDTAIPHLAGALGVPVWVATPRVPDWRWLLQREDCPWYPTMRLFRQPRAHQWHDVFARMAAELEKRMKEQPAAEPTQAVRVEIAPGELIDKITILRIKTERITDAAKLNNVRMELEALEAAQSAVLPASPQLAKLTTDLKAVNETLWEIEDAIRIHERDGDFGPRFIELARSVYHQNDRRAALKRQINELLGSRLIEEKAYVDYKASRAP